MEIKNTTLRIKNLTEEKAVLLKNQDNFVLSYNTIKYGADSKLELHLIDKEDTHNNFKVSSGCQCTTPQIRKEGVNNILNISYNTKKKGVFKQTVTVYFDNKSTKKTQIVKFQIKGNVI